MQQLFRQILLMALIFTCHGAFSQSYNNNWVFGDSIGLNFSTGEPVFFNTAIETAGEACASISDGAGNLLFYTNGHSVWDRTHTMMPNGDNLAIAYFLPDYGSTISQGVVIAPTPSNDSLYYIIYLSANNMFGGGTGLKYSIVNIHLNDGLGDVVEKNVLLSSDTLTEKLQLVKHGNGRDWWLIGLTEGSEEGNQIKFVKYLIKPTGIEGPLYQNYADTYHEVDGTYQFEGYMKFSPQGNKVCIAKHSDADIYDFDRCTGDFSNYLNIDTLIPYFHFDILYAIEFSSDGRYFYIDTYGDYNPDVLYQFCLSCPEPIKDTKFLVYAADSSTVLVGLLLAPNNKIYMSTYHPANPGSDSSLFVINNPGVSGFACDLDTSTVNLGGRGLTWWSNLPNMPNYSLGPLVGSECDTLLAIQNSKPNAIKVFPNPSAGYIQISGTDGIYDAELYNLQGEKIFELKNIRGNASILLPVNNGMYEFVLKSNGDLIRAEKLIIAR